MPELGLKNYFQTSSPLTSLTVCVHLSFGLSEDMSHMQKKEEEKEGEEKDKNLPPVVTFVCAVEVRGKVHCIVFLQSFYSDGCASTVVQTDK